MVNIPSNVSSAELTIPELVEKEFDIDVTKNRPNECPSHLIQWQSGTRL